MKIKTIFLTSLLLLLLGCGKLTLENYSKITVGMEYDKVTGLIGKPKQCDDVMGFRNCTWSDGNRLVNVTFAANQVLLFSSRNLK